MYKRALEYGYVLLTETLPLLDRIVARPQDESRATYFSMADNDGLGERRSFTRADSVV